MLIRSYALPNYALTWQTSKVDFDWLDGAVKKDGVALASEWSKRIKESFYYYGQMDYDDNRLISDVKISPILRRKYNKAIDEIPNVPDDKIFLSSKVVKTIEEQWLNGYRLPKELRESLYEETATTTRSLGPTHEGVVRLDKFLNHLTNLMVPRERVQIAKNSGMTRADLEYFFDTKTGK